MKITVIDIMETKVDKSDNEWREILSPEEYHVLREKGTEPAFTGKYFNFKRKGLYSCAACGNPLFSSEHKFESESGWPSFYSPIDKGNISIKMDKSHGMTRTEVLCNKCGGHLGHLFNDGPEPSGFRYCINSVALEFRAEN